MQIEIGIRNRVAFLSLNRPSALNALTLGMIEEVGREIRSAAANPEVHALLLRGAGDKAFCAGGDVRALYDSFRAGTDLYRQFFVDEYRLDHFLHRFPKPFIAVADGITMGGGMGLVQGSALRIVGDRTRLAMPEVGIGLIPDVGGSYFLSRLPGALGAYLALTGAEVRAGDAIYAQLADLYLEPDALARLEGVLLGLSWSADPRTEVERALRSLAADAPAAPLARLRGVIDRHFSRSTIPAILNSLGAESEPEWLDWAAETAALLRRRSPTMLAVALRALQIGRRLSLADCYRMEFTIVQRCFEQGDFLEGVRALIIDKDKHPQWHPARIEDVAAGQIDSFFRDSSTDAPHPLADLGAD